MNNIPAIVSRDAAVRWMAERDADTLKRAIDLINRAIKDARKLPIEFNAGEMPEVFEHVRLDALVILLRERGWGVEVTKDGRGNALIILN